MQIRSFSSALAAVACFALILAIPTAEAQEVEEYEAPTEERFQYPVEPGTFDLTFTAGLNTWYMPYIEPGGDFGLFRLTDDMTLSIGASFHGSYCFICEVTRLTEQFLPLRISAWYVNPSLRAAAHFNMVAEALDLPGLDLYAGLVAGPGYYDVRVHATDVATGRVNRITLILGPWGGVRYVLNNGNSGFFVSLDGRILAEFGIENTRVELEGHDEDLVHDTISTISRGGFDLTLGVGFRF